MRSLNESQSPSFPAFRKVSGQARGVAQTILCATPTRPTLCQGCWQQLDLSGFVAHELSPLTEVGKAVEGVARSGGVKANQWGQVVKKHASYVLFQDPTPLPCPLVLYLSSCALCLS